MTERKCKCLEEKNKNLATENENVKSRFAIILKDNEHYAAQKVSKSYQHLSKSMLKYEKIYLDTSGNRT